MAKKYIILISYLFMLSGCLNAQQAETNVVLDDLTIVVSSCDKYADCWQPCCALLQRYWPGLLTHNKHVPVILITNEKEFSYPGITVLKTGKDKSWSDNMLAVLETVKTKNVLYLQEDYFLSSPVNEQIMKTYVDALGAGKVGYVELTPEPYFRGQPPHVDYQDAVIKPRFMNYRTSLQPSLWTKDLLKLMIKPGENPWKFEVDGSIRSDGNSQEFLSVSRNYPLSFVNGCGNGFWHKTALDFLEKEGLPVIKTSLPIDADHRFSQWMKLNYPKYYSRYWVKIMGLFDEKFKNG